MENTLKQKLAAGARPIGTFFDTASVSLMECLGRTGLDFAIIDNEHSPIEAETTAALVRAAELSGICPIARVREISRSAVLKLLDVGVQGLIVPNVKTLAQVQELVNYAKYYPIGQRGFCPSRKDGWGFDGLGSVPETMRHFNGETLLFPQCETAEALAIIERELRRMPEQRRRIFIAHRYEEMSYREIAAVYELSEGQVTYELRAAKEALKAALKDYLPLIGLLLNGL